MHASPPGPATHLQTRPPHTHTRGLGIQQYLNDLIVVLVQRHHHGCHPVERAAIHAALHAYIHTCVKLRCNHHYTRKHYPYYTQPYAGPCYPPTSLSLTHSLSTHPRPPPTLARMRRLTVSAYPSCAAMNSAEQRPALTLIWEGGGGCVCVRLV